jgi:hypothetical protein
VHFEDLPDHGEELYAGEAMLALLEAHLRSEIHHEGHEGHEEHEGKSKETGGRLLALAEQQFDVFITGDRNLSFQQSVPQFRIAVVVLAAASTRLTETLPLISKLLAILPHLRPGTVTMLAS